MKTIGIIGGMSPESTVEYYQYLTHTYTYRYGDHAYPPIIMYSVSFQDYIDWPSAGQWEQVGKGLGEVARKLQSAGADFIVIATNTMHKVVSDIQAAVDIPVLNLLDVVADAIAAQGMTKVGLLGTIFTMEDSFYPEALAARGIHVITPEKADRETVNRVVYLELVNGTLRRESRAEYVRIINDMQAQGAQGIILGCTEIPLLIKPTDVDLPLFDTTILHAEAALARALEE